MPALAVVIGNPVTGVEFEPAGNAHQKAALARKNAKYNIALRSAAGPPDSARAAAGFGTGFVPDALI